MKISVIMPAFMADLYIERAIESVIEQSYVMWELIIINDGSSDKTEEIASRYSNQDARVKYYYQPNAGQSKARNLAFKHTQGELIAYLDADDVMLPNHLEVRRQVLEREQVDFVYGPILEVKGKTKKIFHGVLSDTDDGCIMPIMVMHTRRCLQVGGFDEDLVFEEDLEFFLRINTHFKTYQFLEPATVEYHVHEKGIKLE
jgi:glycosyltransferase involved in cell wall biosynthesis